MTKEQEVEAKMAIVRLRVGALKDIHVSELEALLVYIDELELIAERYDNVMESMSVDYEDMFPDD